MLIQELIPDINLENYVYEFKARLQTGLDKSKEDNELKWLKEIVAFSNTQGGTLIVGVNDKTHEVEPLSHQEVDQTILLVYHAIEERIEPSITPQIKEISVGNELPLRYILRIDIVPSSTTPVYVHTNGVPACYIRQFGRSKIATPEQIAQLVIKSTRAAYDTTWTNIKYNPNDFQKLQALFEKENKGKAFNEKLLESIGFMNEDGYISRGALLFKDDCSEECTLAKCSLFPLFDKGGNKVTANEDFKGCLFDVIPHCMNFILSHSTTGYKKTATSRVDIVSFPERALFEGVVNAFAHRNYFIFGAEIQFDIFPDRLEITSPGSLLGRSNLFREKNIGSIQPRRRNEVVCAVLELVHWMEAKGTGFDKIVQEYSIADDNHKPFVSSGDDSFTLTLPDLTHEGGTIGIDNPYPKIHLVSNPVSEYDEKILSCCYYQERSLIEIASYLDISASSYLRKEILEKLGTSGYLFMKRKGKGIVYLTNRDALSKPGIIIE